jgi:hypothetical protein
MIYEIDVKTVITISGLGFMLTMVICIAIL